MELTDISFTGPRIDDEQFINRLPDELALILQQINGFIQYQGGLHVRGACTQPAWHSLRHAMEGDAAFHNLYPDIKPTDIPFAEDCLGDQFLLRDGKVFRLLAETGELEPLETDLEGFFKAAAKDPIDYLSLHPLQQFIDEGGSLNPGQLVAAHPPFCTDAADDGVSLASEPVLERRSFLAELADAIRDLPEDGEFEFEIVD